MELTVTFALPDQTSALKLAALLNHVAISPNDPMVVKELAAYLHCSKVVATSTKYTK
jgi:hypothetical protein